MQIDAFDQHKHDLNRKLLNAYWLLVSIQLPFEFLYSLSAEQEDSSQANHLILPLLILVLIMVTLETTNKFFKKLLDYQIISGGAFLSFTLIYFNHDVKMAPLYTDLYNHITFHEYLDELILQSGAGNFCIHIAVLDIDNFKKSQ